VYTKFRGKLRARTESLDSQADERINDKRRAALGNWKRSEQLSLDSYATRELLEVVRKIITGTEISLVFELHNGDQD